MTTLLRVLPAVLAAAAAPFVGAAALVVAAVLLALALLPARRSGERHRGWGPAVAVVGTGIAAASAVDALVRLSGVAPYADRAALGWIALGLAVGAGLGGLVAVRRPYLGLALTIVAGLAGTVAMAAFTIDTYYSAAVPLWLASAALATGSRPPTAA